MSDRHRPELALSEPMAPPGQKNWNNKQVRLAQVIALTLAALILSKNHADPDFWGHVRYGQDLLNEGLPDSATYTYSAEGFRWINHENLSEVVFATAANLGHVEWLLILKSLSGAALIGWIIHRQAGSLSYDNNGCRKQDIHYGVANAIGILVALNLMHFWSLRPQLFSYLFFAAAIALLDFGLAKSRTGGDRTAVWLLVPLMGVWANTHGGFLAGLAVTIAYVVLQTFVQHPVIAVWLSSSLGNQAANSHSRTSSDLSFRRLAAFRVGLLIACLLVTLINPYGWRLHAWLIESLGAARPEIVEWRPPQMLEIVWWQWWTMVAITLPAIVLSRRARNPVQLCILLLVLWQSIEHQRHIAFFAILFGYWMPPHVADLCARFRRTTSTDQDSDQVPQWVLQGTLALALALISVQWWQQVKRVPVHRDRYPVSAFQYMADQGLHGKLAIQFRWAQYSLAAFADHDIRVGFDGRFRTCYPQSVVDMYFDFAVGESADRNRVTGRRFAAHRYLNHEAPNLLVVDRAQQHACQTIRQRAREWCLLYQDSLAEIWGRRDLYDDPARETYISTADRNLKKTPQSGSVAWPGFPRFVTNDSIRS
jgi:hypothetical protein